jgi:SAM-dependent methyltransferase
MTNSSEPKNTPELADERVTAPLRVEDGGLPARVRKALLSRGYTGDAVRAAMVAARGEGKADYAAMAGRTPPVDALSCLLRAFVYGVETPEDVLRGHVGEELFGVCEEAGLWERGEGGVTGTAVVMVDGKTFLLSDHGKNRLGPAGLYWVMGIGTSTIKLGNSFPRRRFGRVLDLCCGAGVLAFLTAPHADAVVGVDRNPRALNYGRFGAGMNKFPHVEFRESDCYSAVAGEEFDAIVCNPPYVITPDRESYYRDGGMGGDRFAEKVLREAPAHLREGGVAHVMCDVAAMEGKESDARLREWLEGSGCDVLALGARPMEVEAYARNWSKEERPEMMTRLRESLAGIGVTSVTNWLVVLRKRAGANWFVAEGAEMNGYFGNQVERRLAAQDLLERGDGEMGRARLRLAPEARLVSTMRAEGGRWSAEASKLLLAEGLVREVGLDGKTAALVAQLDGKRAVGDVLGGVRGVRGLLAGGFLEIV